MSGSALRPLSAGLVGVTILAGLIAMSAVEEFKVERWLRAEWFDVYQRLLPRARDADPVVIVAIDE